jgi:Rrf2 family protein
MLSKTALLATRALLVLACQSAGQVMSPRKIASYLDESPAYLAKVLRLLVRAGILRAERGVAGGVFLSRPSNEITLLQIVEACQGVIQGDYCQQLDDSDAVCAFHQASVELERAIVGVLRRWTLADLEKRPSPMAALPRTAWCRMFASPIASHAKRELSLNRGETAT